VVMEVAHVRYQNNISYQRIFCARWNLTAQ
jgi:hypothetical protein